MAVGRVVLSRIAQQLPAGIPYAKLQDSSLIRGCVTRQTINGDGALHPLPLDVLGPLFSSQMLVTGHSLASAAPNLFDEKSGSGDVAFEVGGLIHGMDLELCRQDPLHPEWGAKGRARLDIQWQIYSVAKRAVVATIETSGEVRESKFQPPSLITDLLTRGAFSESAKLLAAASEFRALLDAPASEDDLASNPREQKKIRLSSGSSSPRTPADAAGSVVLVVLPDGHGSGVMVSTDGYILTNAHVVGAHRTVKIRWSDGFETEGEVVRVHQKRDVALIKSDTHGREPLSIRPQPVPVGDSVMAIGAPLDEKLQGTVTRGIVSANRVMDGFAFIQSDVGVNHGNSGGPLIDQNGYVVGLTDLVRPGSAGDPIGLNFFIPIRDALDFLSLELANPPPLTPPLVKKANASRAGGEVSSR